MAGKAAFGTLLKKKGLLAQPITVANVTSIEGPGFTTEMLDVTAHDSGDGYRERIPSFLDVGEITLRLNWDPSDTTISEVYDYWKGRTVDEYSIVFPTSPAKTLKGNAYVSAYAPSAPFDGKLEASITLSPTGKWSIT